MAYRPDQYVTKTCEVCGGEYSCDPPAAKHRRYCGNKCAAHGRWQSRGKSPRTEFTCAQCGKRFERSRSYIDDCARKGHSCGVYCSARCKYDAMVVGEHRFTCAQCGIGFTRKQPRASNGKPYQYCSLKCARDSTIKRYTKTCKACGNQFQTRPGEDADYCSRDCYGGSVELTCEVCGKITVRKRSYLNRPGTTGRFCSKKCQGAGLSGERSPHWKGGVASQRSSWWAKQGKRWVAACLARDNYTCQICGQRGVVKRNVLEVHHKASWTKYPALRTHPDNGITLCARCHRGRGIGIHSRSMVALKKQWETEALAIPVSEREVA